MSIKQEIIEEIASIKPLLVRGLKLVIRKAKPNYRKNARFIRNLIVVLLVVFIVTQVTRLEVLSSGSIGKRVVLTLKFLTPEKGDYISIKGQDTDYLSKIDCVKLLVGVAGDKIWRLDDIIYINNKPIARLLTMTRDGKPLTAISNQIIAEGYVFVIGTHKRSYDSRYREFGLVKTSQIVGKSIGLL
jgi:conjugal transfer pilin signal peptidase TrbI